MVKIALSGNLFTQSVANNHIRYRKWEYQYTTATTCNGYDADGNCNSWSGGMKFTVGTIIIRVQILMDRYSHQSPM